MSSLHDKIALITGGGSGIGRATALLMAERGAAVMIAGTNRDAGAAVASEIHAMGGRAESIHMDLRVEADIKAAVEATVARFGRIDILHNNAAYAPTHVLGEDVDILSISTETWDTVMAGTLRGTMLGCRYGVIEMLKTGGGAIINTTSMYGVSAFNRMPAYSVSKGAIHILTQHVATRFGRRGIRCNAIAPSMVRTPMLEAAVPEAFISINEDASLTGRIADPDDIARIVAFLASSDAAHLTGQIIHADGGTTAHLATYADTRRFFGEE